MYSAFVGLNNKFKNINTIQVWVMWEFMHMCWKHQLTVQKTINTSLRINLTPSHIFLLFFLHLFVLFFPISFLPPFVFLIHASVFYKYMWLQPPYNTPGIVTVLHAGKSRNRISILGMTKFFIFSKVIWITTGPTQSPLHWMKGDFRD